MRKSFHISCIDHEESINDLFDAISSYLKTMWSFLVAVWRDTSENRASCANSLLSDDGKDFLTCPMCNWAMNLIDTESNGSVPHWVRSCDECPAVLFEYYDDSNIERLKKCLK